MTTLKNPPEKTHQELDIWKDDFGTCIRFRKFHGISWYEKALNMCVSSISTYLWIDVSHHIANQSLDPVESHPIQDILTYKYLISLISLKHIWFFLAHFFPIYLQTVYGFFPA